MTKYKTSSVYGNELGYANRLYQTLFRLGTKNGSREQWKWSLRFYLGVEEFLVISILEKCS